MSSTLETRQRFDRLFSRIYKNINLDASPKKLTDDQRIHALDFKTVEYESDFDPPMVIYTSLDTLIEDPYEQERERTQGSLGEKRALFQFLVLHFLYYVMNDVALFQLY